MFLVAQAPAVPLELEGIVDGVDDTGDGDENGEQEC